MKKDWRTGEHQKWLEAGGGYKVGPFYENETTIKVEETPEMRAAMQRKEEPAKRFDAGKSRVDLINPDFILALGEHMAFGAEKYGERNWEKGMSHSRVIGSALRHLLALQRGEVTDDEGRLHTIAVAWNAMALYVYQKYGIGTDDLMRMEDKNER